MPLYEYECPNCGNVFERLKKFYDKSEEVCECGTPAHKIISNSSFRLKGGGWYASGYSKNPPKS